MKHIFLTEQNFKNNDTVILTGEDYFHLYRSLRKNKNENITAIFNFEKLTLKTISINKNSAIYKITDKQKLTKPDYQIDIIVPLLKEKVMPFLIEKLTETGINKIYLFKYHYSVVNSISKNKLLRYKKIAKFTSEQSGRFFIPDIVIVNHITVFEKLFNNNNYLSHKKEQKIKDKINNKNFNTIYDKKILLFEKANLNILKYIQTIDKEKNKKIIFTSGPEGSFHRDEINFFKNNNFDFINIGKNILKAETAPIIVSSILYNFFNI